MPLGVGDIEAIAVGKEVREGLGVEVTVTAVSVLLGEVVVVGNAVESTDLEAEGLLVSTPVSDNKMLGEGKVVALEVAAGLKVQLRTSKSVGDELGKEVREGELVMDIVGPDD